MTPVLKKEDMVDGEFYICYELFRYPNEKHIMIGRYDFCDSKLYGAHLIEEGRREWNIYDRLEINDDKQYLFKLSYNEMIKHYLMEVI